MLREVDFREIRFGSTRYPANDSENDQTDCRHEQSVIELIWRWGEAHVDPFILKFQIVDHERTQDEDDEVKEQIKCQRMKERCVPAKTERDRNRQKYSQLKIESRLDH